MGGLLEGFQYAVGVFRMGGRGGGLGGGVVPDGAVGGGVVLVVFDDEGEVVLAGAGGDEVAVADDDEGFGEVAVEGDCAEVGADAGGFAHGDGDGGGGGWGVGGDGGRRGVSGHSRGQGRGHRRRCGDDEARCRVVRGRGVRVGFFRLVRGLFSCRCRRIFFRS